MDPKEVSAEASGCVGWGTCRTLGFLTELKCSQGYKNHLKTA